MAIQDIDNRDYRGKKPNFVRDSFDTISQMKSWPETDIDEGHISVCQEDGYHYEFKSGNQSDPLTGKWRRFPQVEDNLSSESSDASLSAKMGNSLQTRISEVESAQQQKDEELKGLIDAKVIEAGGVSFDTAPTQSSTNPVTSGGLFNNNQNRDSNTGISEYGQFSSGTSYSAGTIVFYQNLLYKFTQEHPAGDWTPGHAERTSIKKEMETKLTELSSLNGVNGNVCKSSSGGSIYIQLESGFNTICIKADVDCYLIFRDASNNYVKINEQLKKNIPYIINIPTDYNKYVQFSDFEEDSVNYTLSYIQKTLNSNALYIQAQDLSNKVEKSVLNKKYTITIEQGNYYNTKVFPIVNNKYYAITLNNCNVDNVRLLIKTDEYSTISIFQLLRNRPFIFYSGEEGRYVQFSTYDGKNTDIDIDIEFSLVEDNGENINFFLMSNSISTIYSVADKLDDFVENIKFNIPIGTDILLRTSLNTLYSYKYKGGGINDAKSFIPYYNAKYIYGNLSNDVDEYINELYIEGYDTKEGPLYTQYVRNSSNGIFQITIRKTSDDSLVASLYTNNVPAGVIDISRSYKAYVILNPDKLKNTSITGDKINGPFVTDKAFKKEYSPTIYSYINTLANNNADTLYKDEYLSLVDGIDEESIENGTSKYDILREQSSNKNMDIKAISVLYNLKKIGYNKQCAFTMQRLWDINSDDFYKTDESGQYIPLALEETDLSKSDFIQKTGRVPLFHGIDLSLCIGTWYNRDNIGKRRASTISIVKKAYSQYKCIPIITWHIENPYTPSTYNSLLAYNYKYDVEGYPQEHKNVFNEILTNTGDVCGFGNNAGTDNEKSYSNPKEWFDFMLSELYSLLDEFIDEEGNHIPVIFRPFHEADIDSFWWGLNSVTQNNYKDIYKYIVNSLHDNGYNSVIMCYGMDKTWTNVNFENESSSFFYRYPGHDYVDIWTFDDYSLANDGLKDITAISSRLKMLSQVGNIYGKVTSLFETGRKGIDNYNFYNYYIDKLQREIGCYNPFLVTWTEDYTIPIVESDIKDFVKYIKRKKIITFDSNVDFTVISP